MENTLQENVLRMGKGNGHLIMKSHADLRKKSKSMPTSHCIAPMIQLEKEMYRFKKERTRRIKQMLIFTSPFTIMPILISGEIGQAWRPIFIKHQQKAVN